MRMQWCLSIDLIITELLNTPLPDPHGRICLLAVFRLLDVVHELLTSGRQATQRDIYYKVSL